MVGIKVVGYHIHAEATTDFYQLLGDAAHANQSDGLAIHVETQQTVEFEIAFACAVDGTIHLAVEGEHKRHGIFSHGMG